MLTILPDSNWSSNADWIANKSHILKDLTDIYLKANDSAKAVEYARKSINFDETFKVNSGYENNFDFDKVYLMISDHLFSEQKYREAIKYLKKAEEFIEDKYDIKTFIKDLKVNNFFKIHNNDSLLKYTQVLENLCFCYMKSNQFEAGEEYFNKKSKITDIVRKINERGKFKVSLSELDTLVFI